MDDPAFQPLAPHIVDFDPAIHDDIENYEMANLSTKDTGVEGTMYISTRRASHGPRTKWYPGRGGMDTPCLTITIADPPAVINNGLEPREAKRGSGPATEWTALNAAELLRFWNDGTGWTIDELFAFVRTLKKLP